MGHMQNTGSQTLECSDGLPEGIKAGTHLCNLTVQQKVCVCVYVCIFSFSIIRVYCVYVRYYKISVYLFEC